jgi:hypothetical protein
MPEFRLVPTTLTQSILENWWRGAQFGLVNISLGQSAAPEVERAVLDEVGSYGRQLGRIGEALREVVAVLDAEQPGFNDRPAVRALLAQLDAVEAVKRRHGRRPDPDRGRP